MQKHSLMFFLLDLVTLVYNTVMLIQSLLFKHAYIGRGLKPLVYSEKGSLDIAPSVGGIDAFINKTNQYRSNETVMFAMA